MKTGPTLLFLVAVGALAATSTAQDDAGRDTFSAALALAVDPSDPDVLYAGFTSQGLYKSRDGGESWLWAGEGLSPGTVESTRTIPTWSTPRPAAGCGRAPTPERSGSSPARGWS